MSIAAGALGAFLVTLVKAGAEEAAKRVSKNSVDGVTKWIKSLFYKDDKPKKILNDINENPEDQTLQQIAEGIIVNSAEGNSQYKLYLEEIMRAYSKDSGQKTTIINIDSHDVLSGNASKTVNTVLGNQYNRS